MKSNTFAKYRHSWRKPQRPLEAQDDDALDKQQDEKTAGSKDTEDILDTCKTTFTSNMSMNQIPTEILLEIFGYLDYLTLHLSVRPACRLFNDIISDTRSEVLAEQLFRKKFDNETTLESTNKGDSRVGSTNRPVISIHPCIPLLKIYFPNNNSKNSNSKPTQLTLDNFGFFKASALHHRTQYLKDFIPLSSTSLLEENALGPIVSQEIMKDRHVAVRPWIQAYGPASEGQSISYFLNAFIKKYNAHQRIMEDHWKKKRRKPDCIGCLMGDIWGIPTPPGFLSVKGVYVHFVELYISKTGKRNIFVVIGFQHKHKYKERNGSDGMKGIFQKVLGWVNRSSPSST